MEDKNETTDLSGKLLIAMPGMNDPRFEKSVVFMCAHTEEGAMGLIVNKPTPELDFSDLLKQLKIESYRDTPETGIYFGGPVEPGRGFVLHSSEYSGHEGSLEVDDEFAMTATRDILEDIALGSGPGRALLALGYAGWGPGQLEGEILQNGWLTCDASSEIVFDQQDEAKWEAALKSLGVDALMLSSTAGHA